MSTWKSSSECFPLPIWQMVTSPNLMVRFIKLEVQIDSSCRYEIPFSFLCYIWLLHSFICFIFNMHNSMTRCTKDNKNPGSIFHKLIVLPTLYPKITCPEYMWSSHSGPVIYPQPRSQQLANGIYAVNNHLPAGMFVIPDLGNIQYIHFLEQQDYHLCWSILLSLVLRVPVTVHQCSQSPHLLPLWRFTIILSLMMNRNKVSHSRPWWIWYIHICISYPLAYLKYLNKYALTANVSTFVKYVNTFVCQNYSRKIVVLCISISGRWSRICRAKLSYINSSDMQM